MTRTARIAILLLAATNVAWAVGWLRSDGWSSDQGDTELDEVLAEREDTIAALEDQIAQLRSERPALDGFELPPRSILDAAGPNEDGTNEVDDPKALAAREAAAEADRRRAAGWERLKGTLAKVMQVEDPALRAAGLSEIEALIASEDPFDIELGLSAVYHIRDVEIDRSGFLADALAHLDGETPGIRRSALYALHAAAPDAAEVRFALAAATDEDRLVRGHAARLLRLYGAEFDGDAARAVIDLLDDDDPGVRKGTLRGFWGRAASEEVQAKLVEVSMRPGERYDAVHHALSPLENKSRAVVDALFTHLEDDDARIRQRAHWGLQRGVSESEQAYVAKRYAAQLPKFLTDKTRGEALQVIARYGDSSLVPDLERFAENELLDPKVRAWARKAAAHLEARPPR